MRPTGKVRGSSGGCAGQDFVDRGLPICSGDGEAATGGGAEEFIGVGWALVTSDVHGMLLQLEEGGGVSERPPSRRGEARGGELTVEGDRWQ
jgi:hypothetical protein